MLLIGIGAGDPDYLTRQAVRALNEVDVFFVLDKGPASNDLTVAREQICAQHVSRPDVRTVVVADPPRDRTAEGYAAAVDDWRAARSHVLEQAIGAELGENDCGGVLVWGDPALYDGTIRVLESIIERGALAVDYAVIPGISSVQALAARHRITLNRTAGSVLVTTGRRLAAGLPDAADDIVVMLDADLACRAYVDHDLDIYWGAYLGTADELLVAGRLATVIDELERTRRAARARKGWIMDTYLLRRAPREFR